MKLGKFAMAVAAIFVLASCEFPGKGGGGERTVTVEERHRPARVREAIDLIQSVPAWSGESYSPNDLDALLASAKRLRALPLDDTRAAIETLCNPTRADDDLMRDSSRVYLVLRALFQVPVRIAGRDAKVFGGWVGHPSIGSSAPTFEILWPLREDKGSISGVARSRGFLGAAYDGPGEFDYFRARFPLRR